MAGLSSIAEHELPTGAFLARRKSVAGNSFPSPHFSSINTPDGFFQDY
jgi:hypothetical protein